MNDAQRKMTIKAYTDKEVQNQTAQRYSIFILFRMGSLIPNDKNSIVLLCLCSCLFFFFWRLGMAVSIPG